MPDHAYTIHCIEYRRKSKKYRMFTEQQWRQLRQFTSTYLFGTILFEMNNWQYSHSSPQSSRRVFIRPGYYTWLASVVDYYRNGVRWSITLSTPIYRGWVRVLIGCHRRYPTFWVQLDILFALHFILISFQWIYHAYEQGNEWAQRQLSVVWNPTPKEYTVASSAMQVPYVWMIQCNLSIFKV